MARRKPDIPSLRAVFHRQPFAWRSYEELVKAMGEEPSKAVAEQPLELIQERIQETRGAPSPPRVPKKDAFQLPKEYALQLNLRTELEESIPLMPGPDEEMAEGRKRASKPYARLAQHLEWCADQLDGQLQDAEIPCRVQILGAAGRLRLTPYLRRVAQDAQSLARGARLRMRFDRCRERTLRLLKTIYARTGRWHAKEVSHLLIARLDAAEVEYDQNKVWCSEDALKMLRKRDRENIACWQGGPGKRPKTTGRPR